jgi:hypothetical protein
MFKYIIILLCTFVCCNNVFSLPCNNTGDCIVGSWCDTNNENNNTVCTVCPIGFYCTNSSILPTPCPLSTFVQKENSTSLSDCLQCKSGKYSLPGSHSCIDCEPNNYCADGVKTQCPINTISLPKAESITQCLDPMLYATNNSPFLYVGLGIFFVVFYFCCCYQGHSLNDASFDNGETRHLLNRHD